MLFKKSYYLVPEETGAKAYALLREAMREDDRVGIAKVSFRDKEHIAALRFKDDAFVLETMFWPDEVRQADFGGVDVSTDVRDQELDDGAPADRLADGRMGARSSSTTPTVTRCLQIVEAKLNGQEIEVVEPEPAATVVDLMEALKASVAAAKKGGDETRSPPPRRRRPRRRRPPRSPRRRSQPPARKRSVSSAEQAPSLPAGYTHRPVTLDDVDVIAAMAGRSEAALGLREEAQEPFLRWALGLPYVVLRARQRL